MKEVLLTILRDKNSSRRDFREATEKLATILALEIAERLVERVRVETPVGKAEGSRIAEVPILVPVLRSGLALLPPFLKVFPEALVGFIGLKRDEETFEVHNYYTRLPPLVGKVVLLEPMVATGNSLLAAINILNIDPENILVASVITSKEGFQRVATTKVTHLVAQIDPTLNSSNFIVPGLGDFGDRYFDALS